MHTPQSLIAQAIKLAETAAHQGEIPVGALIVDAEGNILAETTNAVENQNNPLAHAELRALQQALSKTGQRYLEGCTLAVTLEPCAMCAHAIAHARVPTLIFGAYDPKSGGTVNGARVFNHSHFKPEIMGGIEEEQCRTQLQAFFKTLREE